MLASGSCSVRDRDGKGARKRMEQDGMKWNGCVLASVQLAFLLLYKESTVKVIGGGHVMDHVWEMGIAHGCEN